MAKEVQNLKSRIVKLFLDNVETMYMRDVDSFKRERACLSDNISHYRDLLMTTRDDYTCVSDLWTRLLESGTLSPKETTLIAVFLYLLAAEGGICNDLNFISYLLVATGHDLYSLTKRNYVKDDIEEIRKVEMSTKIQFLNRHGFGALTKEYDSTFRNDIAHHNYKVDEKGILWVRGKRVDLTSKILPLCKVMDLVNESVHEANTKLINLISKMEEEVRKT